MDIALNIVTQASVQIALFVRRGPRESDAHCSTPLQRIEGTLEFVEPKSEKSRRTLQVIQSLLQPVHHRPDLM